MQTVYIETSVVSYAAARLSTETHQRVRQEDARRWWSEYASQYDLFISQAVLDEASRGDPAAARDRLQMLEGLSLIPTTNQVVETATELLLRSALPEKAGADALHVAAAAVGEVKYLLTLNCRHIANAHTLPQIYETLDELGLFRPLICTPQEFFGDS